MYEMEPPKWFDEIAWRQFFHIFRISKTLGENIIVNINLIKTANGIFEEIRIIVKKGQLYAEIFPQYTGLQ